MPRRQHQIAGQALPDGDVLSAVRRQPNGEVGVGSHLRMQPLAAAKPSRATITKPDICRPRIFASLFGYAAQANERSDGICEQIRRTRRSGLAAVNDHDEE